ncbi:hypothetical protein L208DRAFT_1173965, partial [Tricholoma matsutake]
YKPDILDYHAYVSKCDDFLRSPHGHAALLAGSLVTRLARDIVSFDDVYNGPT